MIKQSLCGIWKYRIGYGEWSEREVPFSALAVGHSECEREFDLEFSAERTELVFESITYEACIYLNGIFLGKMLPYCEYRFDVSEIAERTGNMLRVELEDISPEFGPVAGWENFGGIIRDVYIDYRNNERINNVFFSTGLSEDYENAEFNIALDCEPTAGCEYDITLLFGGEVAFKDTVSADVKSYVGSLNGVKLWSPDEPNLYEMQIKLYKNGEIKDEWCERVGFREIKCERHRFLLNGKPVFLKGVCKHEMVGDSGHTVSYDDIKRDMEIIKSLGCNFVRLVHYPHGTAVLDIADELGLMVSEEPGLWWSDTGSPAIAQGSIEVLRRTIIRDRNHASIAFWLCFNECKFTEKFLVDSAKMCKETDPTRLVSGANCMSDEDTLKYYNICGFDFYTMHPYAQTFERSMRSAKMLNDKPLVFTEWGGHFVYDNPKLMREFIYEMRKLYEKNSDKGALAGAFLWCFAEMNDFNRAWPASVDGRLLEGLVDYDRKPRICYTVFKNAWNEDMNAYEYKYTLCASLPENTVPFKLASASLEYGEVFSEIFDKPKPAFLEEQRPRRIKVGPVCEKVPFECISKVPSVLTSVGSVKYTADSLCDGVILLGGTDIVSGYPLSGAYGEKVAELKVKFASGKESCYPLRNGIEITTAFATYRSSRIDPRASGAERFMEFSYNGSFERYVMNKTVFEFDTAEKVESAELIGTDGHIVLTYALLGFKK